MLKVVAVDCNPAQSALLELKATAIRYSLPDAIVKRSCDCFSDFLIPSRYQQLPKADPPHLQTFKTLYLNNFQKLLRYLRIIRTKLLHNILF